jgi:hypothetical protein
VLLATRGRHPFFEQEHRFIRDAREVPIKFGGYSIGYRSGHPHVRIEQWRYLELKAYFADLAVHRAKDGLETEFRRPFEPPTPRAVSAHCVLEVNRRRDWPKERHTCPPRAGTLWKPFEQPAPFLRRQAMNSQISADY